MAVKPEILAFVVCREFTTDRRGDVSLVGIMRDISAPQLPLRPPSLAIYVAVTNVHGPVAFEIRIGVGEREAERQSFTMPEQHGPLDFAQAPIDMTGFRFTERGDWTFDLYWNGEMVKTWRVEVA